MKSQIFGGSKCPRERPPWGPRQLHYTASPQPRTRTAQGGWRRRSTDRGSHPCGRGGGAAGTAGGALGPSNKSGRAAADTWDGRAAPLRGARAPAPQGQWEDPAPGAGGRAEDSRGAPEDSTCARRVPRKEAFPLTAATVPTVIPSPTWVAWLTEEELGSRSRPRDVASLCPVLPKPPPHTHTGCFCSAGLPRPGPTHLLAPRRLRGWGGLGKSYA